jgi:CubicO group peptidase (beta-lactamase class C family)
MNPFDLIRRWPVATAAAAVVTPAGVVAATGPVEAAFPLASVTKPLVALAVLVAVEEGSLGLDHPAGPAGATVRHLLAHASGLAPDDEIPVTAPGSRRIYSNAGFDVLGRELTARTGLAVATYLDEAVSQPLRLEATALEGSPARGAVSSVADLALVALDLLSPTLVAAETLAAAVTPQFPDLAGVLPGFGRQDPNPWGLGVEVRGGKSPHWTSPNNSAATFGHFGRSGSLLWVDPVARVATVVLTDTEFGPWAAAAWPVYSTAVLERFGSA